MWRMTDVSMYVIMWRSNGVWRSVASSLSVVSNHKYGVMDEGLAGRSLIPLVRWVRWVGRVGGWSGRCGVVVNACVVLLCTPASRPCIYYVVLLCCILLLLLTLLVILYIVIYYYYCSISIVILLCLLLGIYSVFCVIVL